MNTIKFKILNAVAIINTAILGSAAYLTTFMFRNNINDFAKISGGIILLCLLLSIITKFRLKTKRRLIISVIMDFILVLYIYNPTESDSIGDYIKDVFNPQALVLTLLYV